MCVAAGYRNKITKNPYFRGLRSFKVVDFDVNRKGVWDFLLVTNNNQDPISQMQRLLGSKWPILVPPSHLVPSIQVTPFEFREKLYGS